MARASIFLVMVALIAGMVGCDGGGGNGGNGGSYTLTVNSTAGGVVAVNDVIIPGKTMFSYDPGTVVSLNATPYVGYCFAKWTGNVSTVGNVTAAITNITMNGNYLITANFFHGQLIRNWYDLDAIRNNLTGSYLLMNDLDSTTAGYAELASPTANGGKGWQPIGNYTISAGNYTGGNFTGIFDGQGYEISDLFINRFDEFLLLIGLFSYLGVGGVIDNVGVVNATVTCHQYSGGLVGWNDGTVSNCYVTGSVTGSLGVSSLIGGSIGIVSNSYSTASVSGDLLVGGLVGWNVGTISNSYSTGSVTGNVCVGGLVGDSYGTVSNCYATGSVTGSNDTGGLVGWNDGNVSNSYSTGSVIGEERVGGLVGYNSYEGTVSNSFWDTQTSGQNISAGGTGKNTTEMQDIVTFSGATWNITTVGGIGERNTTYIWNIVDSVTYPFLSWQSVS